jgi:hypothetical protein
MDSPSNSNPEPLFTGMTQGEVLRLWRLGVTLASIDLAQQEKYRQQQAAELPSPQSHDVDSGIPPFLAAPPHRIFRKADS